MDVHLIASQSAAWLAQWHQAIRPCRATPTGLIKPHQAFLPCIRLGSRRSRAPEGHAGGFAQMKVGVMAVVFGRVKGMSVMKAFGHHAERLGFSTLWAPEHVILVDEYASRYPYHDGGKFPAPTDAPIADPFLTLCTLASVTEKIRLGKIGRASW